MRWLTLVAFLSLSASLAPGCSSDDSDSDTDCLDGCESAADPAACREACSGGDDGGSNEGTGDADVDSNGDSGGNGEDDTTTGFDTEGGDDTTAGEDTTTTEDTASGEDTTATEDTSTGEDPFACEGALACLESCDPNSGFVACAEACGASLTGSAAEQFSGVSACVLERCPFGSSSALCWASDCRTEFEACYCPRDCSLGCGTPDGCGGTCGCADFQACGVDGNCYPEANQPCSRVLECLAFYSCVPGDATCESPCFALGDSEASQTAQYLGECMFGVGCPSWADAGSCGDCAGDYNLCVSDTVP